MQNKPRKSEGTEAKIQLVLHELIEKLENQPGADTFFDNFVSATLATNRQNFSIDQLDSLATFFSTLLAIRKQRFVTFQDRRKNLCPWTGQKQSIEKMSFLMSQGTHSTISWKGLDLYKTAYDMTIYSQIISEVKPTLIVELGSGCGGSAVWLSDISRALGLQTQVLSVDIRKPTIGSMPPSVNFIEIDLTQDFPAIPIVDGTTLFIEDAHVNVEGVLLACDKHIKGGDYLIVEDSSGKSASIEEFLSKATNSYLVDCKYTDFFGRNATCAIDSIFKAT